MSKRKNDLGFGSVCVEPMRLSKKISPHTEPIYATTAYTFDSTEEAIELFKDQFQGYVYSRWANPTVEMAELKITALETHGTNIKGKAQLFSSGMAAISSAMLACASAGEKILTQNQLYGTTDELIQTQLKAFGIDNVRSDMNDLNKVENILKKDKKIRLIYIETPSNPTLEVFDIHALAKLVGKFKIKLAVDNTFSSPYCQQPLKSGADLSIHSATKYINGHGSGLGGIIIGRDETFMKENVWPRVKLLGSNSNAFDAWLILQGLKTLEIRMQRHCSNAKKVAAFLNGHKKVSQVNYCGSKDHPQHKIIKKQMNDHSGMLSFELKGGLKVGIQLMNKVKLCKMITTLGTLDTLIQHPASMTHVNVPRERRIAGGITDGLVRLSVGIENVEDIISDLEQGMK
ncbi:MAG: trans-sulfuration enzyme family protein [Chitinophagales bacterium]